MAEATAGNPQNPKSQGGGSAGDKPEFVLEKFSSVEDQARAYSELEKKYHQDLDSVKQEIKALKMGPRPEELQPHQVPQDDDSQELVEFYKSPSQYRKRVTEETIQAVEQRFQAKEQVQRTLQAFFQDNPDLATESFLLEGYVRQEDPRLDPTERLSNAAKRVREHIINLRKSPEPKPNPAEFVDTPSGSQPRPRAQSSAPTEEGLRKEFFDSRSGSRKQPPKRLPQGE